MTKTNKNKKKFKREISLMKDVATLSQGKQSKPKSKNQQKDLVEEKGYETRFNALSDGFPRLYY